QHGALVRQDKPWLIRALGGRDQRCSVRAVGDLRPAYGRPDHPGKFPVHESDRRFRFAALLRQARNPPSRTVRTINWQWKTESGLQKIEFALGNGAAQDTFPQTTPPWRDVSWTRKPDRNHSSFAPRVPSPLPV